jgi:hypothetical protein
MESTTIPARGRDGLDFAAIGGKRQGREVPQSLRVEPGAKHPVWETQSGEDKIFQKILCLPKDLNADNWIGEKSEKISIPLNLLS